MPAPIIGVIDFSGTVRSSDAGKSVVAQISEQQAAYQKNIQSVTAELEKSRQELARQRTLLDPKVFTDRRRQFQEKARRLQQSVQKVKNQLDASFATGMQEIEIVLAEIVNQVAKENGINIVMNAGRVKGTILFVDSQLVISGEALKRLNKRLPSVDLKLPKVKESLQATPSRR
ncbi:MAG: OmpH family outer membrane protein [Alphaproteobacteria bacterium]|nr:OmpH family outer membrane protein [Alphaproteobacteria bacterium]